MRILRLKSENVKRLSAVEVTPDGSLVIVGGKNGAGKSSVLDSIAYALGGEKLVPAQPIRNGESEAKIVVELDDLVVTRKFRRDKISDSVIHGETQSIQWGPTNSTLVVTNKDGARYPSPQAVLDKLLGSLTFDPLAFSRETPKKQDEILRKIAGIDTSSIEEERKEAASARAMAKKTLAVKEAQLLALPHYEGAPAIEVSMDEVSQAMLQAEEYRWLAEDAEREVEKTKALLVTNEGLRTQFGIKHEETQKRIDELYTVLKEIEANQLQVGSRVDDLTKMVDAAQITAQSARAVVPDQAKLRERLAEVESANAKARANQKRAEAAKDVESLEATVKQHDHSIKALDDQKLAALTGAQMPVAGLGLSDDGVTFEGIPFGQAASSVQLRTSVAIGLALNPKLKVLLVRNGNLLDDDSMKELALLAETTDCQLWCEYVTSDPSDVSVFIEDGHVRSVEG